MRIAFTHNLRTSGAEEQAEFDTPETIAALAAALTRRGHDVHLVEVSGPASRLVARLESLRPDLVFNTAEGSHGRYREAFYPALFDQLGLPFTGSGAYGCTITLDKQATKMLVAAHGVPTPGWTLVARDQPLKLDGLRFPLIVKPNFEGSSKGITSDSVVDDEAALNARLEEMLREYPDGLLVEEFIVGRDVTVPFLSGVGEDGGVLEPAAYIFAPAAVAGRKHVIYDYDLKNEHEDAVSLQVPAELPAGVRAELVRHTATAMRVLGIRDLGRADFRLDEDGRVHFIEVNALPSLEPGASIYLSAARAGLPTVDDVLNHVIGLAANRAPRRSRRFGTGDLRIGLTFNLKRVDPNSGDDSEAEYDSHETVGALRGALERLGHEVIELEATPELMSILPATDIDLVFNIAEGIGGRNREAQVPAMLELLDIEFTGSDAATMAITLDKGLAKRIVAQAGVPTPAFALLRTGLEALPAGLTFPAVVKPNAEGSSKGVASTSVVRNETELRAVASGLCRRYRQPVLVESFLPGREFTVGMIGESEPRVLPPMEIVFEPASGDLPVYTFSQKLECDGSVRYEAPAHVDRELGIELERVARQCWDALGCRDVARIDMRLDARGRVHFIECNPLPGLTPGWSDLCLIATGAGLDYDSLVGEVLAPAVRRLLERRSEERG